MSKVSLSVNKILLILCVAFGIFLNIYSLRGEYEKKVLLYKPQVSNQTMYMPEFQKEGMYPDAFLRALVRNKTVEVWSDFIPYTEYPSHGHDHSDDPNIDVFFSYEYYADNNYGLFFKKYAKERLINKDLPSPEMVKMSKIEDHRDEFVCMGYTTDMLRNSFLVNEDREYVNTYFHYAYKYYDIDEYRQKNFYRMYVADEEIEKADTIVAIWDAWENLYIMSREYYEDNISDLFRDEINGFK